MPDLKRRARAIHAKLVKAFGSPTWRHPLPPIDELISTILSQNTNDLNRDRAFTALRRRFPTWEAARDAKRTTIISAIRVAGLANQKGPRIQKVLLAEAAFLSRREEAVEAIAQGRPKNPVVQALLIMWHKVELS